ncbi:hypothetical protein HRbin30_00627 [bacterium HR30]|nr:hypothetical protein HRbin30_00627 [bacterium HR30]
MTTAAGETLPPKQEMQTWPFSSERNQPKGRTGVAFGHVGDSAWDRSHGRRPPAKIQCSEAAAFPAEPARPLHNDCHTSTATPIEMNESATLNAGQ